MAVALIVVLAPTAALAQAKSGKSGVYEQLNLFGEAFERIRHDAVEPVGDTKLIETAIAGMLAGLGPHSVYLNETEYKALQGQASDESAQTGLVVTHDNGQVKVVAPRDGSPAAAADIKPGDMIFTIDKEPTYDMTLMEIEQKLRGPADSEVTVMLRRSTGAPVEVKLKRAAGKFPTVTARLEAGDIGYIRLAGFDDATAAALTAAVSDLRQQAGNKLLGFIVDLRNNPGGSFDAAVAAADAFIDKGDITVVKSRKPDSAKRIAATPGDLANGQPIVALVNGGTAREAELVAGALQDSHRAVLLAGDCGDFTVVHGGALSQHPVTPISPCPLPSPSPRTTVSSARPDLHNSRLFGNSGSGRTVARYAKLSRWRSACSIENRSGPKPAHTSQTRCHRLPLVACTSIW